MTYDGGYVLEQNKQPLIVFEQVSKSYQEGIDAIDNISIKIDRGEFVFIVGPSGSGKSTFIKLLLREIKATGGTIYVNGKNLSKLKKRQVSKYRRGIGVVFQSFKLLKDRNVYDNIALAQRVVGVPKKDMKKNVPAILSMVGMADKAKAFPDELSGGEQQRVSLARALVNRPAILLADEPTGNLDPKNAWSMMALLNEINKLGTTVIVVTHNPDVVDTMKKRVVAMKEGRILLDRNKGGYLYEGN